MTKEDLKVMTGASTISDACFILGVSRQFVYTLFSNGKQDKLERLIDPSSIKCGRLRFQHIKQKIEFEMTRSSIRNIRLVNVSREKDTVSLMVRYKDNKEYLHTVDRKVFLNKGLTLKNVINKNLKGSYNDI